jgi:hypothetical protein
MTRALVLVLLLATPCAAQWSGTIGGRAVTCIPMPGTLFVAPTGGDAATVTTLGLRCTGVPRGAPRRVIEAQVYVANLAGTLAFDGVLCKRGPSPRCFLRCRFCHVAISLGRERLPATRKTR